MTFHTLTLPRKALRFLEDHLGRCYGEPLPDAGETIGPAECCATDGCSCRLRLPRPVGNGDTFKVELSPDGMKNLSSDAGVYGDWSMADEADRQDCDFLADLHHSAVSILRAL